VGGDGGGRRRRTTRAAAGDWAGLGGEGGQAPVSEDGRAGDPGSHRRTGPAPAGEARLPLTETIRVVPSTVHRATRTRRACRASRALRYISYQDRAEAEKSLFRVPSDLYGQLNSPRLSAKRPSSSTAAPIGPEAPIGSRTFPIRGTASSSRRIKRSSPAAANAAGSCAACHLFLDAAKRAGSLDSDLVRGEILNSGQRPPSATSVWTSGATGPVTRWSQSNARTADRCWSGRTRSRRRSRDPQARRGAGDKQSGADHRRSRILMRLRHEWHLGSVSGSRGECESCRG
jgi:hypothetical protein